MNDETKVMLGAILEAVQMNSARLEAFQKEMRDFKNEMYDFKSEMYDFKGEMLGFKSEMYDFRGEMLGFQKETRGFQKDTENNFKAVRTELAQLLQETKVSSRQLDRRIRMVETDLDLTIERVSALEHKVNER
jgi:predicted  nucleic acid-binding Zn-ribbon protein